MSTKQQSPGGTALMQRVFTAAFSRNILKHDLIPLEHRESTALRLETKPTQEENMAQSGGSGVGKEKIATPNKIYCKR